MMRGIGVAMGSLFMIATAIGCGADEAAEDGHAGADHQAQPPCTEPQTVELGSPARGGNVAFFTTAGGDIDITVRGLADGAIDFGDTTAIDVGSASAMPQYDQQTGVVTNRTSSIAVEPGRFSTISLDPGRYWL